MDFETLFRAILGILLIVFFGIRVYFQKQAKKVERVSRRHERRDRFFYNLILGSYLLMFLYVFTPWLDFAHISLPAWVRLIGVLITCSGIWLFTWSHQTLGANWSGVLEISEGHRLVIEGPYRYVRHPMYSAFFIFGLGILFQSANWFIGAPHFMMVLWMYLTRVASEEAMMIDHFGDAYRQYMTTTRRLLPRFQK